MKLIKVTFTSDEAMAVMQEAADYAALPLSLWARVTLLKEARASKYRRICTTPKSKKYKWLGVECTKEEFEEKSKDSKAVSRDE